MCKSVSPFYRQCFVTLGVSLNSMAVGMVTTFTGVLLDQLKTSQDIILDDSAASWLASITAVSLFLGALLVPSIMGKLGRRVACLACSITTTIGWLFISCATTIPTILIARFLQGLPFGFTAILAPTLIGEYSSPKYRGTLLGTIPLAIYSGSLIVHTLGTILSWKKLSLICCLMAFLDVTIVLLSPESPSILAVHGKFGECKKAFQWLRGTNENDELDKLIAAQKKIKHVKTNQKRKSKSVCQHIFTFLQILKKKEFYKPIIIMFHLHIINEWSGSTVYDSFTYYIFKTVVDAGIDVTPMILVTDIQKIVSSISAVVIIRKLSRRRMLFGTVVINITAYLFLSLYVYGKTHRVLPFDHPLIGVGFINLLVFSTAIGTAPLPNVISGEIFPLEYKGISSTITVLFFSLNFFVNMKIMPFLLRTIGLHGAYCTFAIVVCYGAIVSYFMLPETKDRTLQDIEEEFRGYKLYDEEEMTPISVK